MLSLPAKTRTETRSKINSLRKTGILPGVLYGPKIKNTLLEIDAKSFEKVYKDAGASSLISLEVEGGKKFSVLIHDIAKDPLSKQPIHVDFFQPDLTEEIEVTIPLIFEGIALAVKDFSGTLVKNIHEVEVRALPQNLPHEIKVNIEGLKTLEDVILIENLSLPDGVKILKDAKEIVAQVKQAEKVEEELAKPVEEKVEEVEKVETKKKEEEVVEEQK